MNEYSVEIYLTVPYANKQKIRKSITYSIVINENQMLSGNANNISILKRAFSFI